MNRKGFLLGEETLKIILAVISIGFLVYFLSALYFNFGDSDLKLAEASVEHLVEEINAGATEIEIYNPEGWILINWEDSDEKPNLCEDFDKCICICEGPSGFEKLPWNPVIKFFGGINDYSVKCDEKGFCSGTEKEFFFEESNFLEIKNPPLEVKIK